MKNADGTVTVRTRGRDKRGNTGGGTLGTNPGPMSPVSPGLQGGGAPGIKLTTKRTPVADFR